MLKYNEENVQRQKAVHKQHANATGKNKKSTSKKVKGEKDSDSRASTPSKDLTKDGPPAAQPSTVSTVSSSTSASSSSTASEEGKPATSSTETPAGGLSILNP